MLTRLKAYLRLAGITQEQFGGWLGVSGVSVGRYCRDKSDPEHRQPRRGAADQISARTFGVIHLGNYAEPISDEGAAEMMAEIDKRAREVAQ